MLQIRHRDGKSPIIRSFAVVRKLIWIAPFVQSVPIPSVSVQRFFFEVRRVDPAGAQLFATHVAFVETAPGIVCVGVLVEDVPAAGQIRNSNAPMLVAQARRLGLLSKQLPVVGDDPEATQMAIRAGLEQADILLLTGGVSMGKHDYVPQVLKDEGVDIIFHKVAVKPGKPLLFGRLGEKLVFGLPGNPVSSFVTFELFVRPAVRRWLGLERESLPEVSALAEAPFRNRSKRVFYAPGLAVSTENGVVVCPIQTGGSADLIAFSRANCLVVLPAECGSVPAGARMRALLLEDLVEKGEPR